MFEEPFGGAEEQNVAALLRVLAKNYAGLGGNADPAELAHRLREFHDIFAEGCATGAMEHDDIAILLDAFVAGRPLPEPPAVQQAAAARPRRAGGGSRPAPASEPRRPSDRRPAR